MNLNRDDLITLLVMVVLSAIICLGATLAHAQTGMASFYGGSHHGKRMANGQRFNQMGSSCAHRTKPFGTRLKVTMGKRSIYCTVEDRGPFVRGRIVDVSLASAKALGLYSRGVGRVSIE